MAGLTVTGKVKKDLAKKWAQLPKALRTAQYNAMQRAVAMVDRDLKQNSLTGTKGSDPFWGVTGASGDSLGVRTGHMRRSIATSVLTLPPSVVLGTVGSPLPQAKINEEGGTVSGHPYLRIPTRVMQRPGSGTDMLAGRSAKTLPNTFILKSKTGNLWIAEGGTARARLAQELNGIPLLLYMLKSSVTYRPRHIFSACLKRMRGKVTAMFGSAFRAVVRG